MNTLSGQSVLITGGGSGIGLAAARLFLAEGARVAIAGRDADKLRRAADSLNGGDRLIQRPTDVTDTEQVRQLVEDVNRRFGRIDVLVNNAGLNIKERTLRELTPERWRRLLAGNLEGAFHCMQAVLPFMRERRDGLIINVNSISGKRANPLGGSGYIAAKFALRGLAMGVAAEEKPNGIRVSSIYPGEVDTPILEQRPNQVTEEHRRSMLRPEDVAAAILFIAALPANATVPELVITPSSALYI
ncbi:MAG TPA: oxidoreductase [Planctomycetales bacterium]|jgi:NAD(P)-dependent dehydrogenase (short-subunit alcohol dehydrogenase family)|nr:oxidoreductase [Planctomycetales bacterium]